MAKQPSCGTPTTFDGSCRAGWFCQSFRRLLYTSDLPLLSRVPGVRSWSPDQGPDLEGIQVGLGANDGAELRRKAEAAWAIPQHRELKPLSDSRRHGRRNDPFAFLVVGDATCQIRSPLGIRECQLQLAARV
jgi:hypothetical protein